MFSERAKISLFRVLAGLFLASFLAVPLQASAVHLPYGRCDYFLASEQDQLRDALFSNPKLLISTNGPRQDQSPFLSSNEEDWSTTDIDTTPTDLVSGIGTNNLWDVAVRKNAKALVIADWDDRPLVAQEYFLRPLLLSSKSPQEFISKLAAVPLPRTLESASIDKVFDYMIAVYTGKAVSSDREVFLRDKILGELRPSEPAIVRQMMQSYFTTLLVVSSQTGHNRELMYDRRSAYSDNHNPGPHVFWQWFMLRYSPAIQKTQYNQSESKLRDPFFSFLASQEAFERLRKIMDGNVYYMHISLSNKLFFPKIRALAEQHGWKRHAVSISNVIDCASESECDSTRLTYQQASLAIESLASEEFPIQFLQTRRTSLPHRFETYFLRNKVDLTRQMQRQNHSPKFFQIQENLTDWELIRSVLHKEHISEIKETRDSFEVEFGKKLRVFIVKSRLNGRLDFAAELLVMDPETGKRVAGSMPFITEEQDIIWIHRQSMSILNELALNHPGLRSLLDELNRPRRPQFPLEELLKALEMRR